MVDCTWRTLSTKRVRLTQRLRQPISSHQHRLCYPASQMHDSLSSPLLHYVRPIFQRSFPDRHVTSSNGVTCMNVAVTSPHISALAQKPRDRSDLPAPSKDTQSCPASHNRMISYRELLSLLSCIGISLKATRPLQPQYLNRIRSRRILVADIHLGQGDPWRPRPLYTTCATR